MNDALFSIKQNKTKKLLSITKLQKDMEQYTFQSYLWI